MTSTPAEGLKGSSNNNDTKEYNVFRDSLLRYLGYANEVGESFRYQFPKLVAPSYVVSFGYCFADAATTGYDTWKKSNTSNVLEAPSAAAKDDNDETKTTRRSPEVNALASAADVLIWQSLASVMIPGATINMIVKTARITVTKSPMVLPVMVSTWFPTATGLGSIPLIIHPIDEAVDYVMDNTIRTWWVEEK